MTKAKRNLFASDFVLRTLPTQEPTLTNRGWGTQNLLDFSTGQPPSHLASINSITDARLRLWAIVIAALKGGCNCYFGRIGINIPDTDGECVVRTFQLKLAATVVPEGPFSAACP